MSAVWFSNGSAWSALWIGSLWRASWQGGLFILGIAAVCRLFPRLPVAVRCWLWWLACLKLLCGLAGVAPLALTLLPAPSTAAVLPPAPWPTRAPLAVPVEPRAKAPARVAAPHLMPASFQPAVPSPRRPVPPSPRLPVPPSHPRHPAALLAI